MNVQARRNLLMSSIRRDSEEITELAVDDKVKFLDSSAPGLAGQTGTVKALLSPALAQIELQVPSL